MILEAIDIGLEIEECKMLMQRVSWLSYLKRLCKKWACELPLYMEYARMQHAIVVGQNELFWLTDVQSLSRPLSVHTQLC